MTNAERHAVQKAAVGIDLLHSQVDRMIHHPEINTRKFSRIDDKTHEAEGDLSYISRCNR
jgi:hypothetical protein